MYKAIRPHRYARTAADAVYPRVQAPPPIIVTACVDPHIRTFLDYDTAGGRTYFDDE